MQCHAVREKLIQAAEAAMGIDIRAAEDAMAKQLITALRMQLLSATDRALDATSETLQYYEAIAGSAAGEQFAARAHNPELNGEDIDDSPRNSMRMYQTIDALSSTRGSCQQVIDLAWVGTLTLRNKRTMLEDAGQLADTLQILSRCWSAKRMILKTTTAIERAASSIEGVPSRLIHIYLTEIDKALRIRQLYVRFRRHMQPDVSPDPSQIRMRLRSSGVALAKVIGDDAYEELRIQDRQMLRKIQDDILRWFYEYPHEVSGQAARRAMRLWQDAALFSQCLMMVNNRPELREHDKKLAEDLLMDIHARGAEAATRDPPWLRRMKLLEGRDDELDGLIRSDVQPEPMLWVKCLERMQTL